MPRKKLGEDVTCETCGKVFYVSPSRLKNKRHACSKKCQGILNSKLRSRKVKVPCGICNKDIFYKQSTIKGIANPTCSSECSAKMRSKLYSGKDNPRSLGLNDLEKFFWDRTASYRYRAKARDMDFDLDYKFLMDLYYKQDEKCHYTDLPMRIGGKKGFDTLSLDRVDSKKGYTKDNVVFCLDSINMMKSNHNMQDIEKVFRALILKKDYMIETKIKKLYKDSKLPSQKSPEDAGYDLYVHRVEDNGSYLKVYSGIALQPEIGKFFMLAPRSSSFKKGLTLYNNLGIIDQNYTGEVVAIMYKTFDYISEPKVGDRLVQLVPQQQYKLNIVEVDDFEQTDRNANGFGSSGD